MHLATLTFEDDQIQMRCRGFRSKERLGEATYLEIEADADAAIASSAVLGKGCTLLLKGPFDQRSFGGLVITMTAFATTAEPESYRYRLVVESSLAVLRLRRDRRIFQHKNVPSIIKEVVEPAGAKVVDALSATYEEREYTVQYDETDAAFVRRLCEEEGIYFAFRLGDDGEEMVLEDKSSAAPAALDDPLLVLGHQPGTNLEPLAVAPRQRLRRRVGKVTLRDYNQENPAMKLEKTHAGGNAVEQTVEHYEAPGRFQDPTEGERRARLRLESLRADAATVSFETNVLRLAPGLLAELSPDVGRLGRVRPEGAHFVLAVDYDYGPKGLLATVEAVEASLPFRLRPMTPRPTIVGIHAARTTGGSGDEVTVDDQGRATVKFSWDRRPVADHTSSLPMRVMQNNTSAPVMLPRVGWEVLVAFDRGDPDRPYILGRTYNAKEPPPYGLPDNKTVTVWGTMSSPGGGAQNQIRFDDAAGRQNISFGAGLHKNTTVATDAMTQTAKNEGLNIDGSQSRSVGANEDVSVTEGYSDTVGSQLMMVGGMHKVFVKGNLTIGTGSETAVIGGAVLEKVGNPVTGAANLGKAALLAGASQLGQVGGYLADAYQVAEAGYKGFQKDGWDGAMRGAAGQAATTIAEKIAPGGGTVLGLISEVAPPPWAEPPVSGATAAGGGATSASDTQGPGGPGPGHRNTTTKGAATELIGGAAAMISPGSVNWTTVGASTILVAGSRDIKAGTAGRRTIGGSGETSAALTIKTKADLTREIKGSVTSTVAGLMTSKASGKHSIKAGGDLTLKAGGPIDLTGSTISFVVGGATVTASSQGLMLKAGTIEISGSTKQSGSAGHS